MLNILVEGPDKVGKTSLAVDISNYDAGIEFQRLPSEPIRPLVFQQLIKSSLLFFADTADQWNIRTPELNALGKSTVLDRDIISMFVYQCQLMQRIDYDIAVGLFHSIVYKVNKPSVVLYVANDPFEEYDPNDPFEKFGYNKIRVEYERAITLFKAEFPLVPVIKVYLPKTDGEGSLPEDVLRDIVTTCVEVSKNENQEYNLNITKTLSWE